MLLLRSHKFNNKWIVPGGGVEWGEKAKDTVLREVREETGLFVTHIRFLSVGERIFPKEFYKKQHFVFLDFTARTRGTAVTLNDEAEDYRWVVPKKALSMHVSVSTRRFIQKFLHPPRLHLLLE